MRLLEAIIQANQQQLAGRPDAAVAVGDFPGALPIAALTCIDARLNPLLPSKLGIPEKEFIWLRNAGNIITGPSSSTMRSLALACAVKGAKEVAVIGHTDCQVRKLTALQLLDRLAGLGVDRHNLPANLVEFFGLFGSERQNVIHGVEMIRTSPLIGPKIPIHGLLIDIQTGKLEWVANGYDAPERSGAPAPVPALFANAEHAVNALARIGDVAAQELKLPTARIGEVTSVAEKWLHNAEAITAAVAPELKAAAAQSVTQKEPAKAAEDPLEVLQERMRKFSASSSSPPPPKRR